MRDIDKQLIASVIRSNVADNLQEIKNLLDKGANPNIQDEDNKEFHYFIDFAISLNNKEVNETSILGNTPLHWAVIVNSPKVIKLLLENGANPNIQNNWPVSPLYEIIKKDCQMIDNPYIDDLYFNVIKELLNHKDIDVNQKNYKHIDETILHLAVKSGNLTVVKELLKNKNININLQDKEGNTVWYLANKNGHIKIVEELLKHKDLHLEKEEKIEIINKQYIKNKEKIEEEIKKENWNEVVKIASICKKIKNYRENSWEEIQEDIENLNLQNQPSTSGYKSNSPKM